MRKSLPFLAALAAVGALPNIHVGGFARTAPVATASQAPSAQQQPASTTQSAVASAAWDRWWSRRKATRRAGYPDGPGWSNRHVKRMATKRRNQQRHKAAARRTRG